MQTKQCAADYCSEVYVHVAPEQVVWLLTALLTFPQPYHLPIFGLITRRGGLGEYNSMIHTISERSEALLDGANVRWFQLDDRAAVEDWSSSIARAYA